MIYGQPLMPIENKSDNNIQPTYFVKTRGYFTMGLGDGETIESIGFLNRFRKSKRLTIVFEVGNNPSPFIVNFSEDGTSASLHYNGYAPDTGSFSTGSEISNNENSIFNFSIGNFSGGPSLGSIKIVFNNFSFQNQDTIDPSIKISFENLNTLYDGQEIPEDTLVFILPE